MVCSPYAHGSSNTQHTYIDKYIFRLCANPSIEPEMTASTLETLTKMKTETIGQGIKYLSMGLFYFCLDTILIFNSPNQELRSF